MCIELLELERDFCQERYLQVLKASMGVRLCPICQGKVTLEQVLADQPPPSGRVIGRRMPMHD
jgi:hypothetical protein